MGGPMPPRIDVHVHFLPPSYRKACLEHGHANPDGMPYLPEWDEQSHVELMEKHNIRKSILSISTPGTHLVAGDSQLAAKVARECNAYAADLKRRMPDKFGYWAHLPIPDVDLCLEEIAKCTAEGCDGFSILTSGWGHYLGDPLFDPIFDELNRRKATLFVHPTTPCIACAHPKAADIGANTAGKPTQATPLAGQYPQPMFEFLFDTARAVINMFLSGTIKRCPDIRFILPHLGGTFPPLLSRACGISGLIPGSWISVTEADMHEALQKQFWFDLAGFPFPGQIRGLIDGVGIKTDRIMYGSDFPFTKAPGVAMLIEKMDEGMNQMFQPSDIEKMYHTNAEQLLKKG